MKKFLRSFQDQEAYDAAKLREDFYKPCVSLIGGSTLQYDPLQAVPEGFVDFGLPSGLLWAQHNLGAEPGSTPESYYGDYYAWGETEIKSDYSWETYAFGTQDSLTKYNKTDSKTVLEAVDDVATVTNSAWRMPTDDEIIELITGTSSSWVENYNNIEGLNGKVFTKATITRQSFKNVTLYSELFGGEVTDEYWVELSVFTLDEVNALVGGDIREKMFKDAEMTILAVYDTDYGFTIKQTDPSISMFVPAAGLFSGSSVGLAGDKGCVWFSTLNQYNPKNARGYIFSSNDYNTSGGSRSYGFSVRAVSAAS